MSNRVRGLFFSLLRSALWGRELDVEVAELSSNDLNGVIRVAKSQTVLGLIAHEVMIRDQFSSILSVESREKLTLMVQENFFLEQKYVKEVIAAL